MNISRQWYSTGMLLFGSEWIVKVNLLLSFNASLEKFITISTHFLCGLQR